MLMLTGPLPPDVCTTNCDKTLGFATKYELTSLGCCTGAVTWKASVIVSESAPPTAEKLNVQVSPDEGGVRYPCRVRLFVPEDSDKPHVPGVALVRVMVGLGIPVAAIGSDTNCPAGIWYLLNGSVV